MHTPLCEASGPMLAQQYCSCMAVVYNDACSQTCQRPLAVTGETLLRLIRRRRVFSCGAKTAACTTSHKHIAAEIAVVETLPHTLGRAAKHQQNHLRHPKLRSTTAKAHKHGHQKLPRSPPRNITDMSNRTDNANTTDNPCTAATAATNHQPPTPAHRRRSFLWRGEATI